MPIPRFLPMTFNDFAKISKFWIVIFEEFLFIVNINQNQSDNQIYFFGPFALLFDYANLLQLMESLSNVPPHNRCTRVEYPRKILDFFLKEGPTDCIFEEASYKCLFDCSFINCFLKTICVGPVFPLPFYLRLCSSLWGVRVVRPKDDRPKFR